MRFVRVSFAVLALIVGFAGGALGSYRGMNWILHRQFPAGFSINVAADRDVLTGYMVVYVIVGIALNVLAFRAIRHQFTVAEGLLFGVALAFVAYTGAVVASLFFL
jgi:hypothetical protein